MSMSKFKASNHVQQTRLRGPNDEVDDRATHPLDFAEFNERLGPFTVDVAAAEHNARCDRFYTRETDGLAQSWADEVVWCNPPYSEIAPWIRKERGQTAIGPNERPPFGCVLLVWNSADGSRHVFDPDAVTGGLFG